MKKLLALVLALVMSMSLVTISNAAFSDAKDIEYTEAVEVMNKVGVLKGIGDNKFEPKAELTREQAAKIIAYLDLGETVAEALPAVKVFNDVAADRWSAKFIAYCADAGYINGVGNGNFDPAGKLTGYAFGKMLLCVLGYDASIEEFTGSNWQIAVAKLMQSNDIAKGASAAASAVLTREEAAQYALNALKATMVEYDNKGTNVTINGAVISTGASKAAEVTVKASASKNTYAGAIDGKLEDTEADVTVQLGEKIYDGKLKLNAETGDNADDFGRAANTWRYDGKKVGTYTTATAILTYTSAVKGGDLYTDLGKVTPKAADIKAVKLNGNDAGSTWIQNHVKSGDKNTIGGNGTQIEVYKDSDGKYTFVAVQTFVGKVDTFTAAKKDANGDVIEGQEAKISVKAWNGSGWTTTGTFKTDDFTKQDATDKTIVLLTATTDGSTWTIQSAVKAAKVENVAVTSYKANTNVTAAGTTYKYNENAKGANTTYTMTNGATYTFYLDKNGYVVYNEEYTSVSTDYLYVVAATGKKTDDFATKEYRSYKVVDMEGKVSTVKAYDTAANTAAAAENTIVTMKDDSKNEGYVKFTKVTTEFKSNTLTGNKLDKTQPLVATDIKANAKTVFVLKEGTADSSSSKTYTGIANVPGYKDASSVTAYAVVKDDYATVIFADLVGETAASSAADELVYLFSTTSTDKAIEGDNEYYIYDAVVNGEKTTIKAASGNLGKSGLVKITEYDSDGFVNKVDNVSGDKYANAISLTDKKISYSDPTLTIDNKDYLTTADTVVYMIDSSDDNALTVGTASSLESSKANGTVNVIYVSDKDKTVATIYFCGTLD